ncbi:hypothetical protein QUF72_22060 [Desulfobacterales bacterium HSG2]|nr:hypothetical protein [Desulfobacterales bacterium HSG2]
MKRQFESYFTKALHDAKIEEILRIYRNKRFSAKKNVKTDGAEFDVVVQKNEKVIAFEITTAPLTQEDISRIENLHEIAKSLCYEFRLITIANPKNPTIKIDWLKHALFEYLQSEGQELIDSLSASGSYEEIGDLVIRSIQVGDSEGHISVSGEVSVSLQYGPESDIEKDKGISEHEILPFNGELSLNLCNNKIEHARLKIDTSYWYE